jgi:hypothetical protein
MSINFRLLITALVAGWSAISFAEGRELHLHSAMTRAPLPSAELCRSMPDTCLHTDTAGMVEIAFSDSTTYTVSANGYRDTTIFLVQASERSDTILLAERTDVYELPKMSIGAAPVRRDETTYRQSTVSFTPEEIKTKAGAVEDISRYLGSLPSTVSSLGEGYDNTLFVRGGRPSEITFLVDGIEIENINHFSQANGSGGPIGFINSDYVKNVRFSAGNMPAAAPSRMSSVVDIAMRQGSLYESKQSFGAKLTGGMVTAEGPLLRGESSYALAGRYVDFGPLHSFGDGAGIPKLGDLFAKVFARCGDDLDLSATGVLSQNSYLLSYPVAETDDEGMVRSNFLQQDQTILQGGAGVTLHYAKGGTVHDAHFSYAFRNGRVIDSLDGYADSFFTNRYASNPIRSNSDGRSRFSFDTKSTLPLAEGHSLSFGVKAGSSTYRFSMEDETRRDGTCTVCDGDTPVKVPVSQSPVEKAIELRSFDPALFADYEYRTERVTGSAGVRADYFGLLGDFAVSPRVAGALHTSKAGVFSASFGLYHQFPVELPSILFECFAPLSAMSSDSLRNFDRRLLDEAQPERCWQASTGYDKVLLEKIQATVEAYYKWYDREFVLAGPEAEDLFTYANNGSLHLRGQTGMRRAYGVEITLGSLAGSPFFYSVGGSLFDVKNRYADGGWYNDWTDVGYTFSLSIGAKFLRGHTISASLNGAGGRPYCPEKILADCINRKSSVLDTVISYYLNRLDRLTTANVRYGFNKRIRGLSIETFIELLNVLDYRPTLEYRFNGVQYLPIRPFGFTPIVGCKVQL